MVFRAFSPAVATTPLPLELANASFTRRIVSRVAPSSSAATFVRGSVRRLPPRAVSGSSGFALRAVRRSLLADRVGFRAYTGPQEELGDVLQTTGRLIDEVFGLPGAKIPASHEDLAHLREPGWQPIGRPIFSDVVLGLQQVLVASL